MTRGAQDRLQSAVLCSRGDVCVSSDERQLVDLFVEVVERLRGVRERERDQRLRCELDQRQSHSPVVNRVAPDESLPDVSFHHHLQYIQVRIAGAY